MPKAIAAGADNIEVGDIKKVTIKINKKSGSTLLYDKNKGLDTRIKEEQLIKKTK